MRLATVRTPSGTRAARLEGDELVLLDAPDVGALLAGGAPGDRSGRGGDRVPLAGADLAPVVTAPDKVVCVGLNYADHIVEMGRELPSYPTLFAKFASGLLGPNDDLELPSASDAVDWEVELGVVIGRPVRRASLEEASDAIAGYTVVNDVSMRDWQSRTIQFLQGKAFDATTPVGPVLVTPDELGDPGSLALTCEVDGEVMQRSSTANLVFGPAEIVRYISQFASLAPGDLIATGTPGGVGAGRTPPVFLRPGQVMTTTIERIGSLVNRCVAEPG